MKRLLLVLSLSMVVLAFTGCPGILGPEEENNDDGGDGDSSSEEVAREEVESLSFEFSMAEALIATGVGSIGPNGITGLQLSSDSPLLALTEEGELIEVFSVPDGVYLPPIDFLAVSPTEEAVFVCFQGSLEIEERSMHFLKLYEDGTFEILEETPQVVSFDAAWEGQQEPIAFDSDGGIFYVVEDSNSQSLVKFSEGQRRVLTPSFNLEVERFFSDGSNLFYLGRNRGGANEALYMKVVTPGPEIADVFFRADGDAWIKDTFIDGESLILSGWRIPDPNVEDREYTGILELNQDNDGGFSWLQVYGGAQTAENRANRLALRDSQFNSDSGEIREALIDAAAGQFFVDGSLPDGFDYAALLDAQVDLDASELDFREEITFWAELLDGQTGLDSDFFVQLDAVQSVYLPPFLGYTSDTGADGTLNEFIFDILFTDDQQSAIPVRDEITNAQELNDFLAADTALERYFSSITLKDTQALPLSLPYVESSGVDELGAALPTDYAEFKNFLDQHFDYELTGDTDLTSTVDFDDTMADGETNDIYGIWSAFVGVGGLYPGRGADGSRVSVRYPYRSTFLASDGSADTDEITSILTKYYPNATIGDPGDGAYIANNSSSNKAEHIESAFALGDPRFDYAALTDATTFDTYTADPYAGNNLNTLFDSFDTMVKFTIAEDGGYYGIFEQGGTNAHKVVRMMNGDGNVDEAVVVSDIEGTAFTTAGNRIAWVKPTTSSTGEVLVLDVSAPQAAPLTIVGEEEGLEIFDFALSDRINTVTFTAWSQSEQRSYVGRGDLLTGSFTLLEASNVMSDSQVISY